MAKLLQSDSCQTDGVGNHASIFTIPSAMKYLVSLMRLAVPAAIHSTMLPVLLAVPLLMPPAGTKEPPLNPTDLVLEAIIKGEATSGEQNAEMAMIDIGHIEDVLIQQNGTRDASAASSQSTISAGAAASVQPSQKDNIPEGEATLQISGQIRQPVSQLQPVQICKDWLESQAGMSHSDPGTLAEGYARVLKEKSWLDFDELFAAIELGIEQSSDNVAGAKAMLDALHDHFHHLQKLALTSAQKAACHFLRSRALTYAGRLPEAVAEAQETLKFAPAHRSTLRHLLSLHTLQGNAPGQIQTGLMLLAQDPSDIVTLRTTCKAFVAINRQSEAVELVDRLTGHSSVKPAEFIQKMRLLEDIGVEPAEIVELIDSHPTLADNFHVGVLRLVLLERSEGIEAIGSKIEESLAKASPAGLAADKAMERSVLVLADIAWRAGMRTQSEAAYRLVLEHGEDFKAVAANNLASKFIEANMRLEEACELAQFAFNAKPSELAFLDTLVAAKLAMGLPKQAADLFESMLDPSTITHPAAIRTLARAYQLSGQVEKAGSLLRQARSH